MLLLDPVDPGGGRFLDSPSPFCDCRTFHHLAQVGNCVCRHYYYRNSYGFLAGVRTRNVLGCFRGALLLYPRVPQWNAHCTCRQLLLYVPPHFAELDLLWMGLWRGCCRSRPRFRYCHVTRDGPARFSAGDVACEVNELPPQPVDCTRLVIISDTHSKHDSMGMRLECMGGLGARV